jgi:hypothetical protein
MGHPRGLQVLAAALAAGDRDIMIPGGPMIGRLSNVIAVRRTIVRAIAAVLLFELAGVAAWRLYDGWRTGRVVLTNDGPPLTVQVLDESADEPIGEPVALIRRATLALPQGDYRLRVKGEGRLSRVYRFAVNPGESFTQSLTLDENRLLGETPIQAEPVEPPRRDPIPFDSNTIAVELTPGKADLLEWSFHTLRRRDAATGKVLWDALAPAQPGNPPRRCHPWLLWFASAQYPGNRPLLPAPDVDGDGTCDLVWAAGGGFLALSGKDASVLWTYLAELDGTGGAYPEGPGLPGPIRPAGRSAQMLEAPTLADVDRDGVPDVVATIVFSEYNAEVLRRRPDLAEDDYGLSRERQSRRVVMAVSGRSGWPLWTHAVDPAFAKVPDTTWRRPAAVAQGRRGSLVGVVDGRKWIGLDAATGRPRAGPIDPGFELARPLQYADLDGDGEPEILALGPGPAARTQTLAAFSTATGDPLWTATIPVKYEPSDDEADEPDGPQIVDLDGDGRSEIVVPDAGALDPNNGYRGVALLDGATGKARWTRPMRPMTKADDGLIHIVEAPDLDRDGVRDLVATSMFIGRQPVNAYLGGPSEPERVYVDALSGKDGRPLWWWHVERPIHRWTFAEPPRWWGRGPDGWPLLAIPIEVQHPRHFIRRSPSDEDPATVYMLEASTGRLLQTLPKFASAQVADLDGDGLLDLWGRFEGEYKGDLRAFRGEGFEFWRALGGFQPARAWDAPYGPALPPASDFDGDGIGDTLLNRLTAPGLLPREATGSRTTIARSGRDGRALWKTDLDLRRGWFERNRREEYDVRPLPMPAGDLDGDGTPDVIVGEVAEVLPSQALRRPATLPLLLLSGRTGSLLWFAGPLPLDFEAHGYSWVQWAGPKVIEPGGAPDLIVRHNSPFLKASPTPPLNNAPMMPRLARLSGRTGRIVWDVPLADRAGKAQFGSLPSPTFEDLDGDGRLDALVIVTSTAGGDPASVDLKAVSLHDGRTLWSRHFEANDSERPTLRIIDTDEPGRPGVAVIDWSKQGDRTVLTARALDGRDGRPRWTWSVPLEPMYRFVWKAASVHDGGAGRRIAVNVVQSDRKARLLVLDTRGREILSREVIDENAHWSVACDLDGDGRD